MTTRKQLAELLKKWRAGILSPEEASVLREAIKAEEHEDFILETFEAHLEADEFKEWVQVTGKEASWSKIEKTLAGNGQRSMHRVHFLKTAWFRYAAAIIIIFGLGGYFWNTQYDKPLMTQTKPVPGKNDIAPGSDKAILTLSDGRKVELTPGTGSIAEAGITIENTNGRLAYGKAEKVVFNTMSTPRGGQYQLTLPDGTHVWLNAASSITYPTAFTGKSREVSVTGEAYFDVAKDKSKPFSVKSGEQTIMVLGTQFNIKAYRDESLTTTLVAGSVQVKTRKHANVLVPGQQAIIAANDEVHITDKVNIQETVAWKNGDFYFDNRDLKSILGEFARWYDVEVVYQGALKSRTFFGIVGRDKPLSHVLKLLEGNNIKFHIEGRKLIVQSN